MHNCITEVIPWNMRKWTCSKGGRNHGNSGTFCWP